MAGLIAVDHRLVWQRLFEFLARGIHRLARLFPDGALAGLKLIGFAIWERKYGGRTVTFPARQYAVNGERRSFALLRPIVDANAQNLVRDLILLAYAEQETGA
jgi:hypothetical protein